MLLLVVQAELDELDLRVAGVVDEPMHGVVDVPPVARDLGHRWTRQETALRSRMARADRLVIRVEEVRVRRIEHLVISERRRQEKRLEEPGGVCPVPLRRAHVGHRLDDLVLGGQGRGESFRVSAHLAVALGQRLAVDDGCEGRHRSNNPKQAATQAWLRTGAIHSTTDNIAAPFARAAQGYGQRRAPVHVSATRESWRVSL